MSFFQEYSLLIVVATPVAAIVAMNVFLYAMGERDTLMLPGVMSFPTRPVDVEVAPVDVAPATEGVATAEAANEERRVAA